MEARVLLMMPFWTRDRAGIEPGQGLTDAPFVEAQTHELLLPVRERLVATRAYLLNSAPEGADEATVYFVQDAAVLTVDLPLSVSGAEALQDRVADLAASGWDGAIRNWANERLGASVKEWRDGHPLVFVAALHDEGTDLVDPEHRAALARSLFGTARLHRAAHAGYREGADEPGHATLNANHWVAATSYAAVHYLSPQGTSLQGGAYDAERLGRVFRRYAFVSVLAALQRVRLEGLLAEVARTAVEGRLEPRAVSRAREELARFHAAEAGSQISSRDELQRYADLLRRAFRLDDLLDDAERAIQDLEAWLSDRERGGLVREQGRLAREANELAHTAHRLELFIIGAYAVEVAHAMIEVAHEGLRSVEGVVLVGLAAVGMGYAVQRRGRRRQ